MASRRGARNVRVFGSVARGDADEGSDLDLLIDHGSETDLLDLAGFALDVEEVLGLYTQVATVQGLEPSTVRLRHAGSRSTTGMSRLVLA